MLGRPGDVATGGARSRADAAPRLAAGAGLAVLAGLAWAWTVAQAGTPACHHAPLLPFLLMWTVMMAAMMFPAVVPVVSVFVALVRARGRGAALPSVLFVGGYLVVWGLLGLPARALTDGAAWVAAAVPALGRTAAGAGGAALVACGLYQLTPLKEACLRHCRLPHLFLGHHWRDGLGGAFLVGAHHGLYCAGCCASLMIVLLVVGMMHLGWMVALSALICLEKVLPFGGLVGRIAGLVLVAAGVWRMAA